MLGHVHSFLDMATPVMGFECRSWRWETTTLLGCNRVFGRVDVAEMCEKIGRRKSGFVYPIVTQVTAKS
jgi:hypothetical protein